MGKRQQEKSQQTQHELMDAALELFRANGFQHTSIAEITDHAGYAKGNFYRHWKSKSELFLNIMAERLQYYRGQREPALEKAQSVEDVTEIVLCFLETIIDDASWYKVFLEFTVHAFDNAEVRHKLNDSEYRLSSDLFTQLFAPFISDHASARKLGALVTALFEGFLIHNALETQVLDKEDLRQAILVLTRAYLPELETAACSTSTRRTPPC
ncbi:TetR/AcrR family transcriptional regulator [Desulfohalobium retbaense]|uniref:Transcriptional regulator, TetR family n=1 Tax=Desulfohalobium retbaense (strain ATCC 49708 / DSM 5692 / JCM 16813 / HR100) TaxID=485915 RepID=C8X3Y2_DESRD|nr:TetR/AcrR family transcriptional regulator [Desulfohalobium retbaense]ACV69129.1 transcriptional regulator, TetR family [Desulfohalobium retbaense DSM 5692]